MSQDACAICHDLDEAAMNAVAYRSKATIYSLSLAASSATCPFCKILWDGITGVGLGVSPSIFSYCVTETLRLTLQNILGQSGVETTVQFYRTAPVQSVEAGPSPRSPQDSGTNSAIKFYAPPTRFWDEAVRTQLQRWIGHTLKENPLPRRVLDLRRRPGQGDSILRLLEPTAETAPYVTLSHCWVNRTIPTTTAANLHSRLDSIDVESLPQTFREAIMVCRWLSIQYIWIDSLCIVQDDPVDWEQQAAQMDTIYENAHFTIAAHGSAGESILPSYESCPISTTLSGLAGTLYCRRVPRHEFLSSVGPVLGGVGDVPPDEIYGRGWCYQERLLSQQILHLTGTEVLHEDSRGRIKCQCEVRIPHEFCIAKDKRPGLIGCKSPSEQWREVVAQYTQKAFSRPWDILPGLAGIARRFQQKHGMGDYVAGLWSHDIVRWLCWKSARIALFGALNSGCENCGVWPRQLRDPPPHAQYIVPSFSWASRIGACEYFKEPWHASYRQVSTAEVVCLEPALDNPLGRFLECSIRIRGRLQRMIIVSTVARDRKHTQGCRTEYAYLFDPRIHGALQGCDSDKILTAAGRSAHEFVPDTTDNIPADGQSVYIMELFRESEVTSIALVLKADGHDVRTAKPLFSRIGICFLSTRSFNKQAACETEVALV